jgi:hypothetical protein
MDWNPIARRWHRVIARFKSACDLLYRALAQDWLAKITLKDHYAERRHSS